MKPEKEIKEMNIQAHLIDGILQTYADKSGDSLTSFFENLGIYEFIKKEHGTRLATHLMMKIDYSDSNLIIHNRIIKNKECFRIADVCERLIDNEMLKIRKKLAIQKVK